MNKIYHFCAMSLPIGQKIKAKIKEKGWSVKKFADESNMSYRNAMSLFHRSDLGIEHVHHLSKVLDYDFFQDYRVPGITDADGGSTDKQVKSLPKDYTTMVFQLTIAGDSFTFERFPQLLKKVRKSAEDLGFDVM